MNTGFRIGRFAGIDIKVHWSVLLIAVVLANMLGRQIGYGPAAVGVAGFMISILAHEFGHALTARRYGVDTESIQLWALGGVARLDREAPSAKAEGWIAVAGPLVSAGLGGGLLAIWYLVVGGSSSDHYVALLGWLGVINGILAVFNMLPGAPLDGGRLVKAVRWAMHGDKYRATREASSAGVVIAALVGGVGVALLFRGSGGMWLMITGAFIWANAKAESAAADYAETLDGVKVGDLTWYGIAAAGTDMDADTLLWQRRRLGAAGGVSITDDDGRPLGVALEHEMWAVPADERPWMMLTQMMVPLDRTTRATADDELSSLLPRLNPIRPVVTVWDGDRMVGMIPPKRLHEALHLS